jgi:hypothetical protein
MYDAKFSLWRDRIKASAECVCVYNMWFGKWYCSSLLLCTLVISCQGASTIVISFLISIKGFTHIGTHDNTMHCSTFSEILSHSVHCVCVCANTPTHAHIDTKHGTVSETTSRWHILLQVITEISTVSQESFVLWSDIRLHHQLSVLQAEITLHFAASFCYLFLHVFGCLHF